VSDHALREAERRVAQDPGDLAAQEALACARERAGLCAGGFLPDAHHFRPTPDRRNTVLVALCLCGVFRQADPQEWAVAVFFGDGAQPSARASPVGEEGLYAGLDRLEALAGVAPGTFATREDFVRFVGVRHTAAVAAQTGVLPYHALRGAPREEEIARRERVAATDRDTARVLYFAFGGQESDIGARPNASWYWRRLAGILEFGASTEEFSRAWARRGAVVGEPRDDAGAPRERPA
jgi:hypothetical protein